MNRVDGKVALVTGGTKGFGAETARLLAAAGARVAVAGRSRDRGDEVVARITEAGGEALFCPLDVTREADWERVMGQVTEAFGGLHVLVNNAGVFLQRRLEETTLDDWRAVSGVNLEGVLLGAKHGLGVIRETTKRDGGGGAIINVASTSGIVGMPFAAAYSMTKGGVRLFTKAVALECAHLGYPIRVNAVCPTFSETDMFEEALDGFAAAFRFRDGEAVRHHVRRMHPLERFATAADVARAVLFLASDDSSYMTGTELVVDGGFTAR